MWLKCKVLCERMLFSRTFVEQIVDVAALGSSMRRNAMWHVPQSALNYVAFEFVITSAR